jgi:hypothetical protein
LFKKSAKTSADEIREYTVLKWYKYNFNTDLVHERVVFIFSLCNIKIHANSTEEKNKIKRWPLGEMGVHNDSHKEAI